MAANHLKHVEVLVTEGRFGDIAPHLDNEELTSTDANVLSHDWPIVPHMLGHIYNNNLEDARFLWKRIPDTVKQQDAELAVAFLVLQAFWNKGYQDVWPALASAQWSPLSRRMVEALSAKAQAQGLALLSRAYSTISAAQAAAYLGVPAAQLAEVVESEGWQLDAATGMYKVVQKPQLDAERAEVQHLEHLAQYMVHLESSS